MRHRSYLPHSLNFIFGFILVAVGFAPSVYAQVNADAKIISESGELRLLNSNSDISYRLHVKRELEILTEKGLEYANVSIYTYPNTRDERIESIEGYVTTDGFRHAITKDQIIKNKLSEYVTETTLALPNVAVGSKIYYEYSIYSEYVAVPRPWEFQHKIPCEESKYTIHIPSTMAYAYLINGGEFISTETKQVAETNNAIRGASYGHEVSFELKDIPALIAEPHVSSIDNYRFDIRLQLDEIVVGGRPQKIIPSWKELNREFWENELMGLQVKQKGKHKAILNAIQPILDSEMDDKTKIDSIYHYLTGRISWNGDHRLQTNQKIDDAFIAGTANSAELNMMMMVALNKMDVEWHPILASTANNRFISKKYPLFNQFNHILSVVELDGQQVFLDLFSRHSKMGDIHPQLANTTGWISQKKETEFVDFEPGKSASIIVQNISFDGSASLTSNVDFMKQGYGAISLLEGAEDQDCHDVARRSMYLAEENIIDLNCKTEIARKSEKQIVSFKFDMTTDAGIMRTGDDFFWTPIWPTDKVKQPFKLIDRSYPVEFQILENQNFRSIIKIPEGYEVASQPESVLLAMPDNMLRFQFTSAVKGDQLEMAARFIMKKSVIPVELYPALKEFYDKVSEKLTEPIFFKKK